MPVDILTLGRMILDYPAFFSPGSSKTTPKSWHVERLSNAPARLILCEKDL